MQNNELLEFISGFQNLTEAKDIKIEVCSIVP